jgi:hypothetical protein
MKPVSKIEWLSAVMTIFSALLSVACLSIVVGISLDFIRYNDISTMRIANPAVGAKGSIAGQVSQQTESGPVTVLYFGPNTRQVSGPPGAEWPEPGKVYVSPELAKLSGNDPFLRALVPGEVVGTISADHLRTPDELLAYVGYAQERIEQLPGNPVASFGNPDYSNTVGIDIGKLRGVVLVTILALVCGVLAMLFAVTKMGMASRKRRMAAGVLLGMRSSTLAWVSAIHNLLLASLGAVIALPIRQAVSVLLGTLSFGDTKYWDDVAMLPSAITAGIVLFVILAAAYLGYRGYGTDAWAIRRRNADTSFSLFRIIPLALGIVILLWVLSTLEIGSSSAHNLTDGPALGLTVGVAICVIGLVVISPLIPLALDKFFMNAPLLFRVACARAVHMHEAVRWVGVGLAFGIVASGVSMGLAASLSEEAVGTDLSKPTTVIVQPEANWNDDAAFAEAIEIAFASDTFQAAFAQEMIVADEISAGFPEQRSVTDPSQISTRDEVSFTLGWADASRIAGLAFQNLVDNVSIPHYFRGPDMEMGNTNRAMFNSVAISFLMSIIMVVIGMGVSMIGMQMQRDEADSALLAIGMPLRTLRLIRSIEVVMGVLPIGILALFVASLGSIGFQHVGDVTIPIDWPMIGNLALSPLVMAALLAVAAAIATPNGDKILIRRD